MSVLKTNWNKAARSYLGDTLKAPTAFNVYGAEFDLKIKWVFQTIWVFEVSNANEKHTPYAIKSTNDILIF